MLQENKKENKKKKRKKQKLRRLDRARFRSCRIKVRFECQSDATKNGKVHGLRAYHCSFCDGWHLTKRPHWKGEVDC